MYKYEHLGWENKVLWFTDVDRALLEQPAEFPYKPQCLIVCWWGPSQNGSQLLLYADSQNGHTATVLF